ncbi:unnamed protein product [Closterium sp. NIES-54]
MPVAKKSDVLWEFQKWLVLVERQAKNSVLMLRSDRRGEFLGKAFTDFVDDKGIVHDLACPYNPQQNGNVHSCRVRNFLERSRMLPGTTLYQLLTGKKPDLTLAQVWGCMVQFMVPEQQCGGKLAPKARRGLHLGVSPESKGWEVLDLTDNKVVKSVEVIFYKTLSLEITRPATTTVEQAEAMIDLKPLCANTKSLLGPTVVPELFGGIGAGLAALLNAGACYVMLSFAFTNDMFQHIKDLVDLDDSGPKAWKLLRDVIQPNMLPMVITLEKEFASLSMRPGDDVKPVLEKIKDTYARMAAAGSNVSQMQQCTKIISVLDNSWDNLIPTLNSQQEKWTSEWLRQKILQEDFRRRHTGGGAAHKTTEGYGAAGGSRGRGGGRFRGRGRGFGRGRGRGLSANLLSMHRLQKSKAKIMFGPTSCRGKLGKFLLWDLEEKSSCIMDLWQLLITPWNGNPPTSAAAAATAKAAAGGEETAPTDGALHAVKKVQQSQQPHGEVLAGVDATAAWAKASSGSVEADWEMWHERLCHVNFPMLQKLVKDASLKELGMKEAAKEIGSCPTCLETKFTKFPFNSGTGPAKASFALLHIDVVGPFSLGQPLLLNHCRQPRVPCAVLKKKGIQHQLTVPYISQQNGVAESFNRTLQEGARTLLGRAELPDPFWVTALREVALVKNRVLATVEDKQWVPYTK